MVKFESHQPNNSKNPETFFTLVEMKAIKVPQLSVIM